MALVDSGDEVVMFQPMYDAYVPMVQRAGGVPRIVTLRPPQWTLNREDLARAALVERKKAADMSEQLKAEISVLDDSLRAYEEDIHKLQSRLREARSRQSQIAARLESAENRVKLRSLMTTERVDEALTRFDALERRVDYAEGRADQLKMESESGKLSLSDEIAALEGSDKVDEELEEMKRALGKGADDAKKGD